MKSQLFSIGVLSLLAGSLIAQPVDLSTVPESVQTERLQWFYGPRVDANGRLPVAARVKALDQIQSAAKAGRLGPMPKSAGWRPLGPQPLSSFGTEVSGRVADLVVHPDDDRILYAAAAQGGVWKSTDAGFSWTPLTDGEISLAMGALAIDPTRPNVIYAGTGEAHLSADSYFGAGLLKSVDGGSSWSLLAQDVFLGASFSDLLVDPDHPQRLFAAVARGISGYIPTNSTPFETGYGVYRSEDGGVSWDRVFGDEDNHPFRFASSLVMDPTDSRVLYVAFYRDGGELWKSTDSGETWNRLLEGLPDTFSLRRGELAISSDGSTLIAGFQDQYAGGLEGLFKSTDRGATWTRLAEVPQYCSTRCWYNHVLAIHPQNSDILYAGGVDLVRSMDGGATWQSMRSIGNGASLHVDQHALLFDSAGHLLVGNDGGVYRSPDPTAATVEWQSLNHGLNTIQMYPGLAQHASRGDLLLVGTQDNGCNLFEGDSQWSRLGVCGDGAYQAVDFTDPDQTWYTSSQYLRIRRTTDGGETWQTATDGLPMENGRVVDAPFIAAFEMCPDNSSVLIAGTSKVFRSVDGARQWVANSPDLGSPDTINDEVSALAFVPGSDCRSYYAATRAGWVWKTTNGGAEWMPLVGISFPWSGVTDLAVPASAPETVYASLTGFHNPSRRSQLFKSTDGGTTWQAIFNGLPNIPFNTVETHPEHGHIVYAGADVGVFRSLDGGAHWQLFDQGLPRVAVFDLKVHRPTGTLRAATHGRGAWELPLDADPPTCVPDETTLCLGAGRFAVQVTWHGPDGGNGFGKPVTATDGDSALWWFFEADNWELMVKVLDGCALNDFHWVFAAATTDVAYTLKVTDTQTGLVRSYANAQGQRSDAVTDTKAFASCP